MTLFLILLVLVAVVGVVAAVIAVLRDGHRRVPRRSSAAWAACPNDRWSAV